MDIAALTLRIKSRGATCQTLPRRTIGPSQRRWRFRKRATSRSSRAGTARHTRERRPVTASRSSRRSSRGPEAEIRAYGKRIEDTIAASPHALAPLQLHYLRWVLFDIGPDKYFMYQGIFDTDFDKYTEDAVQLFKATGVDTVFEKLEGFPTDWKTNAPAFIKFVREHQCPSFLEYGEYPYVSAAEIKKALALKQAFSSMLDQMQ